MAKYVVTATSRSGQKVNAITGAPSDEKAIHSDKELREFKAAAAADPRDLDVTVRPLD
ncbi:hypothetical protein [Streptomyces candidus]|uniref:Uncharacterized protein n=1 Tax=Streptomyces candidus TaxID=67283 RepID=A0A7X0LSC7_9ACTN|nr:hypothetical protein [Streptomyces candidus]MBB6439558.1 hypothetical protein [Streptomyces candidus]GHH54562.1 hypothetical protein GCM10018773_57710 [Streptomyces candidus]